METKATLNIKELSDLISTAMKSQHDYIDIMVKSTAKESAKEVVKELTPVIVSQMKDTSSEIAKRVVKDACEKLVLEVTGESYENKAEIKSAIQWSIKAKNKSNMVTNRVILVMATLLTGVAISPLIDWIKKF